MLPLVGVMREREDEAMLPAQSVTASHPDCVTSASSSETLQDYGLRDQASGPKGRIVALLSFSTAQGCYGTSNRIGRYGRLKKAISRIVGSQHSVIATVGILAHSRGSMCANEEF